MAERMVVIPTSVLKHYQTDKSEERIETEIDELLYQSKLPDDMKVKLLSQLIKRYHNVVHPPPKPIPVSITKNESSIEDQSSNGNNEPDSIRKLIDLSVPLNTKKYVPLITSALQKLNYGWNEKGELTVNNEAVIGSHIADLFSYIMHNRKEDKKPTGFSEFLNALQNAAIPQEFIKRKNLKPFISKPVFKDKSPVRSRSPSISNLEGKGAINKSVKDHLSRSGSSVPSDSNYFLEESILMPHTTEVAIKSKSLARGRSRSSTKLREKRLRGRNIREHRSLSSAESRASRSRSNSTYFLEGQTEVFQSPNHTNRKDTKKKWLTL